MVEGAETIEEAEEEIITLIIKTKTKPLETHKTLNKSLGKGRDTVQTHHIAVVITTSFMAIKVGFVKLP